MVEAVDSLSLAITSHALGSNSTFPLVTLPNFEAQGANTRILSGTVLLNYAPLVTDENRKQWEEFALENRQQFIDAVAAEYKQRSIQDQLFETKGSPNETFAVEFLHDSIHNLDTPVNGSTPEGTGPYLPIWQQSPAVPFWSLLNFNLLSHPTGNRAYREVLRTGSAALDFADNLHKESDTGGYVQLVLAMGQYRDEMEEFLGDPSSVVAYPVFDSLNPLDRTVVGVFSTTIYWRLYFSRILPSNAQGVHCVLVNSFNQSLTYLVDGPNAFYLGPNDLHDRNYDNLVQSADLNDYIRSIASKTTKSYTSVNLNDEFSSYKLFVYPSADTESAFRTNEPMNHTIVVSGVILFTSIVFLFYDYLVRLRQKVVMDRAVASGAIVSSLFPSQVKDKLYKENEQHDHSRTDNNFFLEHFFHHNSIHDVVKPDAPIIADLYPSTTILFADVAGFTKWCSHRSPEQVLGYWKRLPKPQEAHAVIMAKFASECMMKMHDITASLSETLGEDTAQLELRVGLHSGSVTAGVLRGQKSRFQLFGPSMNQASRMESTGVPGKIQVSQETANELIAHEKGHWLQQREDKVVAKGLGDLTTYWVIVNKGVLASSVNTSTTPTLENTQLTRVHSSPTSS